MIAIVNYGSGNAQAIANVYHRLGIPHSLVSSASAIDEADRVILPGVGAFDQVVAMLGASGLRDALDRVAAAGRPILGVCVGMQILAERSSEGDGATPGLGWISGDVRRFDRETAGNAPLPHMGWNTVEPTRTSALLDGVDLSTGFYFLHSYYMHCGQSRDIAATTTYGTPFASVVEKENVAGVQFHPEKSHHAGTRLLRNFALSD